jgi:hypothetical protein
MALIFGLPLPALLMDVTSNFVSLPSPDQP